jgi:N-acylneuraminate cytidylyltransferase
MNMRVQAYIFARGGSKGVPGKNIRPVAGKPLLVHAIETALACKYVSSVIVSTDDERIAEIAVTNGAVVPFMRPSCLAQDTSPEWSAWRHALVFSGCTHLYAPFDIFLSVPATAPLRLPEDLDTCIERLAQKSDTDAIITVRSAARHPAFNMVSMNDDGSVFLASTMNNGIFRRQDMPPLYEMTTVAYALRPTFIMKADSIFDGLVRAVCIPQERALDIDTELDLKIADFMLKERKGLESCVR